MRRLGFGLMLLWLPVAAQAAQPEISVFSTNLDLFTVQTVQFDANGLARTSRYRFTASIVPIHSGDTAPFGFGFSNTSHLTPAVEGQKEIAWATNPEWTRCLGGDRTSWSPRLRIESRGQRFEIIPRRHSVWIQWRKELP
jgi:hypothetical protein